MKNTRPVPYDKVNVDKVHRKVEQAPCQQESANRDATEGCPGHADISTGVSQEEVEDDTFYSRGFEHRHWVLLLCAAALTAEWTDRSVMSLALESVKHDFRLTDLQVGLVASASQWVIPFFVLFVGRWSDLISRSKLLAAGVLGWALSTAASAFAPSYEMLVLSRVLAGVSNCGTFPVCMALLADLYKTKDLTKALGFFYLGGTVGDLLGMAVGGLIMPTYGWRGAFLCLAPPQLLVSGIIISTVHVPARSRVGRSILEDICNLLNLPAMCWLLTSTFVGALLGGSSRFAAAFAFREYHVDEERFGLVTSVTGAITAFIVVPLGSYLVTVVVNNNKDKRGQDDWRWLLWCAAFADFLECLANTGRLFAPSFNTWVAGGLLARLVGSMTIGTDPATQLLALGRRGTTQGLLEIAWASGRGGGAFVTGVVSDVVQGEGCDPGCALRRAFILLGSIAASARIICHLMVAQHVRRDVATVEQEFSIGPGEKDVFADHPSHEKMEDPRADEDAIWKQPL